MPPKKSNVGMGVALLGATVILGGFTLYLYTFNYNARPLKDANENIPMVRASVDVNNQLIGGAQVLMANLHLTNTGRGNLKLLDTVEADPLYNLQLNRVRADGGTEMVGMQRQHMSLTAQRTYYDPDRDTEVVLLPGRTLTVHFPLMQLFELQNIAGKYRLDISYHPDVLMEMLPRDQNRPSPDIIMVACATEFEFPLPVPQPMGTAQPKPGPAVEKPAPISPGPVPPPAEGSQGSAAAPSPTR